MRPKIKKLTFYHFFSVAQQSKSGLGCLFVKVSRLHSDTHTHTHTHTPGKTPLKEAGTYTPHNKHNKQTSSAGFEPAIPGTNGRITTSQTARPPGSTLQCLATLVTHPPTMYITERLNRDSIFEKPNTGTHQYLDGEGGRKQKF